MTMRERQPIDDLFKQALFHAEVTPPAEVRAGLAHKLGWVSGARGTGGYWAVVILAVGLVGAGISLWSWKTDIIWAGDRSIAQTASTQQPKATRTDAIGISGTTEEPSDRQPKVANNERAPSENERNALRIGGPSTGKVVPRSTREKAGTPQEYTAGPLEKGARSEPVISVAIKAGSDPENTGTPHSQDFRIGEATAGSSVEVDAPTPGPDRTIASTGSRVIGGQGEGSIVDTDHPPGRKGPAGSVSTSGVTGTDQRSFHIAPKMIAANAELVPGEPISSENQGSYVLPSGVWWIGPYLGFGVVDGKWKGERVEGLDRAEKWRSTKQAGIILAREWRNGWSVSGGIGLSAVRSTFNYTLESEASNFTEVDTSWAQSTIMSTSIYTWVIDTIAGLRPGMVERLDSRNSYTAIQVPITVAWHGDLRRFRYGGSVGLMAWIPTQRKGLTLFQDRSDTTPMSVPLQDGKVKDRFGTQVHGTVGLSVGYSITEKFGAYLEPMVTAPLITTAQNGAPWLTRPLIQIRLQYELR